MTAYKRRARYQQALWRTSQGHAMGTHPTAGGPNARPLGSRLVLDEARGNGLNFITPNAWAAAKARLLNAQPHQTLDEARLLADLLSSMPMCFNLLGDLHADADLAEHAARSWWADLPGRVESVVFEWSPGRRDPDYLNNRTAFDAALVLDLGDGAQGIVGIETKYHEHPLKEATPGPGRIERYTEVAERSGVFMPGALPQIVGTPLQQIWLDHLLMLAMLQHPSKTWAWGRFVLVHPAGNVAFGELAAEYRELLADTSTFEARTVESLLYVPGALPGNLVDAFSSRYLWT